MDSAVPFLERVDTHEAKREECRGDDWIDSKGQRPSLELDRAGHEIMEVFRTRTDVRREATISSIASSFKLPPCGPGMHQISVSQSCSVELVAQRATRPCSRVEGVSLVHDERTHRRDSYLHEVSRIGRRDQDGLGEVLHDAQMIEVIEREHREVRLVAKAGRHTAAPGRTAEWMRKFNRLLLPERALSPRSPPGVPRG